MSLIISFVPVFTVFASVRNAFFTVGESQGVWWLGFPVFIQAPKVQFLGRELRSRFTPPPTAASLRSGFPPPASFLRVAPPMDDNTRSRVVFQELGFVPGAKDKGEKVMRHKPWVFLQAHSTLIDNPGRGLSLRLWLPK